MNLMVCSSIFRKTRDRSAGYQEALRGCPSQPQDAWLESPCLWPHFQAYGIFPSSDSSPLQNCNSTRAYNLWIITLKSKTHPSHTVNFPSFSSCFLRVSFSHSNLNSSTSCSFSFLNELLTSSSPDGAITKWMDQPAQSNTK